MRILYLALKYDYGRPEQGYSFEHYNFYDALRHLGGEILYFDFMTLLERYGRAAMNRRLWEVVRAEHPDVLFSVLFQDQLLPRTLRRISEETDTVTCNWFCDDHWRFDNFSRYWAPCFNWVVTTDAAAVPRYHQMGYAHVMHSQWACNHHLYRHLHLPPAHEVTFVGQPHGNRREMVALLADRGVPITAWGNGWEAGRVTQEEMIRLFNQSRINLNLANASYAPPAPHARLIRAVQRRGARALAQLPGGASLREALYRGPLRHLADTLTAPVAYREQIKGRNFEVPGCGGFLLTNQVDGLAQYYEIGREIVCFSDTADLLEKIHYFLQHEEERLAIAQAGYTRTLNEHTYTRRFTEIFRRMGLAPAPPNTTGDRTPGPTEEVQ